MGAQQQHDPSTSHHVWLRRQASNDGLELASLLGGDFERSEDLMVPWMERHGHRLCLDGGPLVPRAARK